MTWQDAVLGFTAIVSVIELFYLIRIFLDDHLMRILTEESLEIQKKSLNAQSEYLGLRRKWYESRAKKKDNEKVNVRPDGSDTNVVQRAECDSKSGGSGNSN